MGLDKLVGNTAGFLSETLGLINTYLKLSCSVDVEHLAFWLLSGLTLLEEINLASSPVSSLDELADLLSLRTIHLEHTRVSDLTPLGRLMKLETVTVSRDMLPLVLDPEARYEVVLVK